MGRTADSLYVSCMQDLMPTSNAVLEDFGMAGYGCSSPPEQVFSAWKHAVAVKGRTANELHAALLDNKLQQFLRQYGNDPNISVFTVYDDLGLSFGLDLFVRLGDGGDYESIGAEELVEKLSDLGVTELTRKDQYSFEAVGFRGNNYISLYHAEDASDPITAVSDQELQKINDKLQNKESGRSKPCG